MLGTYVMYVVHRGDCQASPVYAQSKSEPSSPQQDYNRISLPLLHGCSWLTTKERGCVGSVESALWGGVILRPLGCRVVFFVDPFIHRTSSLW